MYGWCRHAMPTFPYKTVQNSQTRQLQALLDTYTYSTSASVPTKTLKVRKIHSYMTYRNGPTPFFGFFCSSSSSSSSIELAYCQSATSTLDGFYTKQLLSVAGVTLDQQNLRNLTQSCVLEKFPYLLEAIFSTCTCIPRFIERRGSSARVR